MINKHKSTSIYLVITLLLIVSLVILLLLTHHSVKPTPISTNTCVSKQLSVGSKGSCVSDAQTMIDFMESDGLTQCPFTGSSPLTINGTYDANTEKQVMVIQAWLICYDKQEGEPVNIISNGTLTPSTWLAMCTYAYIYPSESNQSSSTYLNQSILAGKNAGCVKS